MWVNHRIPRERNPISTRRVGELEIYGPRAVRECSADFCARSRNPEWTSTTATRATSPQTRPGGSRVGLPF